jgi:hypothetical protein
MPIDDVVTRHKGGDCVVTKSSSQDVQNLNGPNKRCGTTDTVRPTVGNMHVILEKVQIPELDE